MVTATVLTHAATAYCPGGKGYDGGRQMVLWLAFICNAYGVELSFSSSGLILFPITGQCCSSTSGFCARLAGLFCVFCRPAGLVLQELAAP